MSILISDPARVPTSGEARNRHSGAAAGPSLAAACRGAAAVTPTDAIRCHRLPQAALAGARHREPGERRCSPVRGAAEAPDRQLPLKRGALPSPPRCDSPRESKAQTFRPVRYFTEHCLLPRRRREAFCHALRDCFSRPGSLVSEHGLAARTRTGVLDHAPPPVRDRHGGGPTALRDRMQGRSAPVEASSPFTGATAAAGLEGSVRAGGGSQACDQQHPSSPLGQPSAGRSPWQPAFQRQRRRPRVLSISRNGSGRCWRLSAKPATTPSCRAAGSTWQAPMASPRPATRRP